MFPFKDALLSFADEIKQIETERANALQDAQNKTDALVTMTAERNAADEALEAAKKTIGEDQIVIAKHAATILNQQKQIADLTNPPVIIPPIPQKITRQTLPRIYGLTIEKGKEAPSSALYTKVKTAMKWGAGMGFNYWRGFFNVGEVAEHLKAAPVYGNLITYGQSLGLRFIADTIDSILLNVTDDTALKLYLDGLIKLGCEGVYINDANRHCRQTRALTVERHCPLEIDRS